jgi:HEPN domain-containing protein
LAWREIEYPRRHDVGELLELVKPLAPDVAHYAGRIINLAPYAVEIRYEIEFEPSDDQAVEAVQTAEEVYELIKRMFD